MSSGWLTVADWLTGTDCLTVTDWLALTTLDQVDNDGNHHLRWRDGSMTLNGGQHKVPPLICVY